MIILAYLYFMLPGILANMMPVLMKNHWAWLAYPVDFNQKWFDGKNLLGDHKTWRGLISGTGASIIIVATQKWLMQYEAFEAISMFPYDQHSAWLVGFLIGFGALFGDMVKSFIKRRIGIEPGKKFMPWDQIDAAVGAIALVSIIWPVGWWRSSTLIATTFVLHILVRNIGYYLKVNKERW
jgi:CDP-2,3-bis-(O-geranylgeranyl)-sn-glycerol synthase